MLQTLGVLLRGSGENDVAKFRPPFEIDIKEDIHYAMARIRLQLRLNRRQKESGAMEEGEQVGFRFFHALLRIRLLRSIVGNLQQPVVGKNFACSAKIPD